MVPGSAADIVRRLLLAIATALIVARPVVTGEDPGLTGPKFDASNLVLTQLWLVLAAGWFCWRLWAGVDRFLGGLVELALLVVVILTASSGWLAAPYKHPAYLVSWEWLGFLAALFVVRQLAVTSRAQHGLFSALLAIGVTMAALACYQSIVELPRLTPDPARREIFLQRLAVVTYGTPGTLATFLILVLPSLVGSFFIARQEARPRAIRIFLGTFALLGLLALYCTRCESAWIALALSSTVLVLALGWRTVRACSRGGSGRDRFVCADRGPEAGRRGSLCAGSGIDANDAAMRGSLARHLEPGPRLPAPRRRSRQLQP